MKSIVEFLVKSHVDTSLDKEVVPGEPLKRGCYWQYIDNETGKCLFYGKVTDNEEYHSHNWQGDFYVHEFLVDVSAKNVCVNVSRIKDADAENKHFQKPTKQQMETLNSIEKYLNAHISLKEKQNNYIGSIYRNKFQPEIK